MSPLYIETPVLTSHPLERRTGRSVSLKLENLQPSGSFKMRGISALCQHMVQSGQEHLISSSGGNAGYTAALVASLMGKPATIFVPEKTAAHVVAGMERAGATVVRNGRFWAESHAAALSFAAEHNAEVIHPFDHPVIWEGHASMVDEFARQTHKPDAVLLTVGGGGLLAGVAMGLQRQGWDDVSIVAVETVGADTLARSIQAGKIVRLPEITSSVKTLGADQVCVPAFEATRNGKVLSVVVTDDEAINACSRFMEDHRMLVEPACGAALSLLYNNHAALAAFRSVLVIVCGGVSFTLSDLRP